MNIAELYNRLATCVEILSGRLDPSREFRDKHALHSDDIEAATGLKPGQFAFIWHSEHGTGYLYSERGSVRMVDGHWRAKLVMHDEVHSDGSMVGACVKALAHWSKADINLQ